MLFVKSFFTLRTVVNRPIEANVKLVLSFRVLVLVGKRNGNGTTAVMIVMLLYSYLVRVILFMLKNVTRVFFFFGFWFLAGKARRIRKHVCTRRIVFTHLCNRAYYVFVHISVCSDLFRLVT